jgi:SAM-dependent methyltransferase
VIPVRRERRRPPPDLRRSLRESYDRRVDERDNHTAPAYELREREAFRLLLCEEQKRSVLELGAAAGRDGEFFQSYGLDTVCIDLSPEMVRRCRSKGLTAHVMDLADLRFPSGSFDAAYAMNSLVHLPRAELPAVLREISQVVKPDGLVYVGMYGGYDFEGTGNWDPYEPKRFFSFLTDEHLQRLLTQSFDVHSFKRIPHGWAGLHFQSVVLRQSSPSP